MNRSPPVAVSLLPWEKRSFMPSFAKNALLLLLALSLVFNVGCGAPGYANLGGGDEVVCASDSGDAGDGVRQIRHGGGELAVYAFVGLLIVTVFTLDLLLLPFTKHDPFPCCRGVLSLCN
jgi:hypothetical protein